MGQPAKTSETSALVTAVFRAWHAAAVPFLVLRNYERLPEETGNDIDVLVQPFDRPLAEATLRAAASEAGFQLANRGEFATLALYFASPATGAQVHFDLFTDLKWRGFDFLDCGPFLGARVARGDFAVPHPAQEAATNLLAYFIFTGRVKEKYRAGIAAAFQACPEEAREIIGRTYGHRLAEELVEAGAAADWNRIERRLGTLRRELFLRQALLSPARAAASFLRDAARVLRRAWHPPGMTVILCGTDGSGKSTAARGLIEGLQGTFSLPKGRQFHWKPPVFSGSRQAARGLVSDPHGRPPRPLPTSLAFFALHWLEFLLGWPRRILPATFRGGLVLIDRYYFDFLVDQRRYRLRVPDWLVRLGYRLLPKPDLVLLFDAPVAVLQARKQELTREETGRQREAFLALVRSLPNGRVIDASLPADQVAAEAVRAVLDHLTARAAGHPTISR